MSKTLALLPSAYSWLWSFRGAACYRRVAAPSPAVEPFITMVMVAAAGAVVAKVLAGRSVLRRS